MRPGSKLKPNKLYYTFDGAGAVIKFNEGRTLLGMPGIITPKEAHTPDVWCAGICRKISDIFNTKKVASAVSKTRLSNSQ